MYHVASGCLSSSTFVCLLGVAWGPAAAPVRVGEVATARDRDGLVELGDVVRCRAALGRQWRRRRFVFAAALWDSAQQPGRRWDGRPPVRVEVGVAVCRMEGVCVGRCPRAVALLLPAIAPSHRLHMLFPVCRVLQQAAAAVGRSAPQKGPQKVRGIARLCLAAAAERLRPM